MAALSTAEVLQRQRLDLPFYVEQYGVPQQYGVRKDKENSGETDSRKGATEGGFDVVHDNLVEEGTEEALAGEEEVFQVEDVSENGDEADESFNPLFGLSVGLRSAPNLLGCLATAVFDGSQDTDSAEEMVSMANMVGAAERLFDGSKESKLDSKSKLDSDNITQTEKSLKPSNIKVLMT